MPDLLSTALELADHGYSVIPIRADGSKSPAVTWKQYTTEIADEAQVRTWFTGTDFGLGVVQGAVSGNAELAEIEGRAAHRIGELRALAAELGLTDLWDRLATGWLELSPSGGFHFHYRVTGTPVPGNLKLARGADKIVLAETRGAGGQVVVAPSGGAVHPSGKAWTLLAGGPATAPVLDAEERHLFHVLLSYLDEMPEASPQDSTPREAHDPREGITPGDDYENQVDWADILTPHGWTLVTTRGRTRYWRRPGKDTGLWSASTGRAQDRDRLWVFSSSTDFEQEVPYTKLGAYAMLEHGGDHSAAAKALHGLGYGQRATRLAPDVDAETLNGLIVPRAPQAHTIDGSLALAVQPELVRHLAAVADVVERDADPNEDNTALLLVDQHAGEIRYSPGRGTWLAWDGCKWAADDTGHAQELARAIARRLPDGDGWTTYRKRALSYNGVKAVLGLAATDPRIVVPTGKLDARPYELNTPAGIVDLRTGALRPADPNALHTRSTVVAPEIGADHPLWSRFLADTFAGDPEMTTYVQRLLGVSLVGVVLEQILPFAFGSGKNGKSTLMSTVQHVVGLGSSGYAMSAPAQLLLATRNDGHPTEIARLSGARIIVTSELEDGQRFAEAKVKLLTGKDTLTGRFMGKDFFDFQPTHTLWTLANHKPNVRSGGPAFWRRVRLLPFIHEVPDEKRIKDLEDQLIEKEAAAILGWIVAGARDYFAHGLAEPASVTAATAAYEHDQDTIGRFVEDRCETGATNAQHLKTRSANLRTAYESWCRTEGEEPVSAKALTTALVARFGVATEKGSGGARFLAGIRLLDDDGASSDTPPDAPHNAPLDRLAEGW